MGWVRVFVFLQPFFCIFCDAFVDLFKFDACFFLVTHLHQKLPLSGYYISDVEAD